MENIPLNIEMPFGANNIVGHVEDAENNKIVYFNENSYGINGIYEYDIKTGETKEILVSQCLIFPQI